MMRPSQYPGIFVTFEGLDGCGKTTHVRRFLESLRKFEIPFAANREPGSTPLCSKLREVLFLQLESEKWSRISEVLLFYADRAQHLDKLVIPALQAGKVYVSDRYVDSTYAYQGYQGADVTLLDNLNELIQAPEPDVTYWLRVDPKIAHVRALERNAAAGGGNHYDTKPLSFYQGLDAAFERHFDAESKISNRLLIVDSSGDEESVAKAIWAHFIHTGYAHGLRVGSLNE